LFTNSPREKNKKVSDPKKSGAALPRRTWLISGRRGHCASRPLGAWRGVLRLGAVGQLAAGSRCGVFFADILQKCQSVSLFALFRGCSFFGFSSFRKSPRIDFKPLSRFPWYVALPFFWFC